MAKRLFIGKLSYDTTNNEVEEMLSQAGKVVSVNLISDRYTGQSKGFAFAEMGTEEEAQKAIQMFNGQSLGGRTIVVSEARPQEDRGGSRGGGFGGGGYGGGNDRRGGFGGGNDRRGGFNRTKRW